MLPLVRRVALAMLMISLCVGWGVSIRLDLGLVCLIGLSGFALTGLGCEDRGKRPFY